MASNRVGVKEVVGVVRVHMCLEDLSKFKALDVRLEHWRQPSNSAWLSFTSNHGSQDHC